MQLVSHTSFSVSSAIVQRYLTHILDAALSQNAQIQAAAIDVLTFTIKQGLAHPLQVWKSVKLVGTAKTLFPVIPRDHCVGDQPLPSA